ncbi:hypothetical protein EDB83DRAFT_2436942, partial [Lactarius deliciosus]
MARADHSPSWDDPDAGARSMRRISIFGDLCLLGNGERPQFLQLEYLHKIFTLELIESVLTNYFASCAAFLSLTC